MLTKEQVLQDCIVDGITVKLPPQQLERKLYQDVAKSLELIGGKWKGGKVMGFVFNEDPTDLLAQIANGEKRNLKKEFQFFATPEHLADLLVEYADVNSDDIILEPSAGQGAIIKAIHKILPGHHVAWCETMPVNQTFLYKLQDNQTFIKEDFLTINLKNHFTKIIANPPFSKNQDIEHITKMYECLKSSGRLVSIASKHWQISGNKKESQFREWLLKIGAEIHEIDAGEFKESGTTIAACIIIISKL